MEHLEKPSEDGSEVIFAQPGEGAGATGPYGLVLDRRKEDGWLDDTEPCHGARPRTTEVDRSVDDVLSATIGGTEQDLNFRDTSVPKFPPEQRIRQEEKVQTPPRREPRRDEGQQPKGPRSMINGTVLAPGGLTDQRTKTAGRNRQTDEWSPVAALDSVTYAARSGGPADREPVSEDAEVTGARAPRTTSNGWGDTTAALQLLSHLQDDALSLALLIPMPRRASRKELTDALSSHYGSPGRLANYRREFDKTVRKPGEDPSNFAIT